MMRYCCVLGQPLKSGQSTTPVFSGVASHTGINVFDVSYRPDAKLYKRKVNHDRKGQQGP